MIKWILDAIALIIYYLFSIPFYIMVFPAFLCTWVDDRVEEIRREKEEKRWEKENKEK